MKVSPTPVRFAIPLPTQVPEDFVLKGFVTTRVRNTVPPEERWTVIVTVCSTLPEYWSLNAPSASQVNTAESLMV